MALDVWIYDLNKHRFLGFYFSVFFSVLLSTYQILKAVFDHISNTSTFFKISTPLRVVFSTLSSVFRDMVERSLSFLITSNTRDSVSSGYPNTEKRVENTTRSGVFLTKFEVFG